MTAQTDTKLPEWPILTDAPYAHTQSYQADYERARADAAMARLMVAVEALKHQAAMVGGCDCHEAYTSRKLTDPNCVYHNYELCDVEEALATIGPLPDVSS